MTAQAQVSDAQDAAALVRSVRERESWIERVESLSIKAVVRWELPPEGIAKRRRDLQAQFPEQDVGKNPDLRPRIREEVELAFDHKRVRKRNYQENWGVEDLRVWDGRRFILQNRYDNSTDQDGCLINRNPDQWLYWLLWVDFPAFRAGHHSFWWVKPEAQRANEELAGRPRDFAYEGKSDYRGVECHIVSLWGSWTTLFVGVADGRLRGIKSGNLGGPGFEARELAWFERKGHKFPDIKAWADWFAKRTPEERLAVNREQSADMTSVVEPCFEFWLEDEKEVAPGCWLPMKQGSMTYFLDEGGKLAVQSRTELKITEIFVNQALPDSLFEVTIRPGDRVSDETLDPPLQYRQKAKFTPEEWAAIVSEGKKKADKNQARDKKQAALIGQDAPAFPEGAEWLNGKPIRWADLAGKVVLLDFWAEWCGPCRNDLPSLAAIHEKRADNGLVVIGVHPPGSDPETIRKVMADFGMDYPICIDMAPPAGSSTWGRLYDRLGVDRLPHAVVIDRRGKVAATGSLQEVIEKASELARAGP